MAYAASTTWRRSGFAGPIVHGCSASSSNRASATSVGRREVGPVRCSESRHSVVYVPETIPLAGGGALARLVPNRRSVVGRPVDPYPSKTILAKLAPASAANEEPQGRRSGKKRRGDEGDQGGQRVVGRAARWGR